MAARTLAIVGARLNSSRLPRKHLLELAGRPVIGRLLDRLATIPEIDRTVIATTADVYNQPLVDWAAADGAEAFAFTGDVDDLVGRIDAMVEADNPDIVVYVCGDCPLVEPETLQAMIRALLNAPENDVARLDLSARGGHSIHEGFMVFRRSFWDAIVAASVEPFEREHVGVVFARTGKVTPRAIAMIEDDPVFSSIDHRISVDTPSDYAFMNKLYERWYAANPADSIVSLRWAIEEIRRDQALAAINADVKQKGIREQSAKILMLADARPGKGLGHIKRSLYAADILRDRLAANVELVMLGEPAMTLDTGFTKTRTLSGWDSETLARVVHEAAPALFVADLAEAPEGFEQALEGIKNAGAVTLGLDHMVTVAGFDRYYVPSFHVDRRWLQARAGQLDYGWDCYLLPPMPARERDGSLRRLIVMTGGSDPSGLAAFLPAMLDPMVPSDIQIDWVRGPAAEAPDLAGLSGAARWTLLDAPSDLAACLPDYDAALCSFGVSFFEALAAGLKVIAHDPIGALAADARAELAQDNVALLIDDLSTDLTDSVRRLLDGWSPDAARMNTLRDGRGQRLTETVKRLLEGS